MSNDTGPNPRHRLGRARCCREAIQASNDALGSPPMKTFHRSHGLLLSFERANGIYWIVAGLATTDQSDS